MAIGLSRFFGIQLPLNFNSPYKSRNIIEFWRRWHMTLSRFLRDYLYIAIGGNQKGQLRRYFNLGATMVLGGLWHGAGWNFVIWGSLHGAYLMINHAWNYFCKFIPKLSFLGRIPGLSIALTFFFVCIAWVFFRSSELHRAVNIIQGLFGVNGIALPDSIGAQIGGLKSILENLGIHFYLGGGTRFIQTYFLIIFAAVICFCFPNTQEIMENFEPALDHYPHSADVRNTQKRYDGHPQFVGLLLLEFCSRLVYYR